MLTNILMYRVRTKEDDTERTNMVLYVLMEVMRYVGVLYQPLMPTSSNVILDQLGVPKDERAITRSDSSNGITTGEDHGRTRYNSEQDNNNNNNKNDDDATNKNNDKSLKSKEYSSRRERPTRLHDNPPPTPLPPRAKRNRRRSPLRRPSKQHAATAASRTRWAPRMTSALRGAARRNGMLRSDTILRLWGGVNLNKLWLV